MMKLIVFLVFLNLQNILALSRDEICSMELETGRCFGEKSNRWYFNKAKQTCEQFVYTGCGGNANSFATERQCLGTCGNICKMPTIEYCFRYTPRFFFDPRTGRCEIFATCREKMNSFYTLKECMSVCQNECTLPPETGLCRARMQRYFYNTETQKCESFFYGGCGGNANNFKDEKECESRCRTNSRFNCL